ncbi:hypothetical protein VH88_03590 [Brevundimonas sp. KM4]|nr:hypothetical protein VH88_03590 [Brevundimonas sp. KM4]
MSAFAAQCVDEGDAHEATAGENISALQGGEPAVTLILSGVAARRGSDGLLSRGLASEDDAINFDAVMGEAERETAVWLTPGRFLSVSARKLAQKMDRDTLVQAALTDLRRRNAALQVELSRHATLKVAQRLAALMLDVRARNGGDLLALRQTELSDLMAVRRASISTACTELCAAGAVRLRRGAIQIIDAGALRRLAGEPHSTVTDLARLRG